MAVAALKENFEARALDVQIAAIDTKINDPAPEPANKDSMLGSLLAEAVFTPGLTSVTGCSAAAVNNAFDVVEVVDRYHHEKKMEQMAKSGYTLGQRDSINTGFNVHSNKNTSEYLSAVKEREALVAEQQAVVKMSQFGGAGVDAPKWTRSVDPFADGPRAI